MIDYELPVGICEYCGATKEPSSYVSSLDGKTYGYYKHNPPSDCLKHLRSLIDDIGSRRTV